MQKLAIVVSHAEPMTGLHAMVSAAQMAIRQEAARLANATSLAGAAMMVLSALAPAAKKMEHQAILPKRRRSLHSSRRRLHLPPSATATFHAGCSMMAPPACLIAVEARLVRHQPTALRRQRQIFGGTSH